MADELPQEEIDTRRKVANGLTGVGGALQSVPAGLPIVGGIAQGVGELANAAGGSLAETVPPALVDVPPPAQPVATTPQPMADAPFVPPPAQTTSTSESRTQIQGGAPIDKGLLAEQHRARSDQASAMARQAGIEADAAHATAMIEAERAKKVEAEQKLQEKAVSERKAQQDAQLQKIRDAQKELDANTGPAEDGPGSAFAKKLALVIGAFGQAFTGQPNAAVAMIDRDRATKLTAWRAQYERMKGRVGGAQNLYAQMREKGFDDATAEAAVIQKLNERYASTVRQISAESKAPIVLAQSAAAIGAMKEQDAAAEQALKRSAATTRTTIVDNKSKTGGTADIEGQGKLLTQLKDEPNIVKYRLAKSALGRFTSFEKAGASGSAFVDFVAGKAGMDQGSFGPAMQAVIHKNGWLGEGAEKLRAAWAGGVQPGVMKEIRDALAIDAHRTKIEAQPAIKHFQTALYRAGIDPALVIGGETPDEAASSVGAAPAAYQGRQ